MAVQAASMNGPGKLVPLPDVAQVAPHVTRILGQNPSLMTLQGTNSYLLQPPNSPTAPCILVDTTSAPNADAWVALVLGHLESTGASISDIVLTHRHMDHTGGLVPLLTALKGAGAPPPRVWKMRNPDEETLSASERENDRLSCDASLAKSLAGLSGVFTPAEDGPVHDLQDGDEVCVEAGGQRVGVRVLPTPGHTQDSISLVVVGPTAAPEVFTGDTVLGQGTTIFFDFAAYMASLRKLAALAPATIYPAHGPTISGQEQCDTHIANYIKHRQEREDKIVAAMQALAASPASLGAELDKIREHAAESADAAVGPGGAGGAPPEAALKAAQAAKDSEPIAGSFPRAGDEGAAAATVSLLARLVYKSGHEGLIWAASLPMRSHLVKLEQEGRVRRVRAKLPTVVDWKVTEVKEEEGWEWCGDEAQVQAQM